MHISPKSACLSVPIKIAELIVGEANRDGIPLKVCRSVRDLGGEFTAGARHTRAIAKQRLRSRDAKAERACSILKIEPRETFLVT